jgi:hypothetical protein
MPPTARDILEKYGVAVDEELERFADRESDQESYERVRQLLVDTLDKMLVSEMTGGADWSVRYAWAVPSWMAHQMFGTHFRVFPSSEIFLTWDEGRLSEPLYFVSRIADGDAGDYDLSELTFLDARVLERMQLLDREHRKQLARRSRR